MGLFGSSKSTSTSASHDVAGTSGVVAQEGSTVTNTNIVTAAGALNTANLSLQKVAQVANSNIKALTESFDDSLETVRLSTRDAFDFAGRATDAMKDSFDDSLESIQHLTGQSYALVEGNADDAYDFSKLTLNSLLSAFDKVSTQAYNLSRASNEDSQSTAQRAFEFVDAQRSSELKTLLQPILTAAVWLFGIAFIVKAFGK